MFKCLALLLFFSACMVSLNGIEAQVKKPHEMIQKVPKCDDCFEVDLNISEPRFCRPGSDRVVIAEFGE